jgi:hypothetical protein
MTEKKVRIKIPQENKVRAELQKEIGSVCPFCDNTEVGHFEIHHIDDNPANNDHRNLILLCPICHSKITKGDISQMEVLKKKIDILTNGSKTNNPKGKVINFNSKIGNAIVGDNNQISIKQTKKVVEKYPLGCLGYDTVKANYVGHLIQRYNEYKESEVGKGNVKYGIFGSILKKQFKIGATRTIYNLPIERFEELVSFIQNRIDTTKLGRINKSKHKNYSSFDDFKNQVG